MILLLLALLGVWGHRHHWQMPRFSEILVGERSRSAAAAPEPDAAVPALEQPDVPDVHRRLAGEPRTRDANIKNSSHIPAVRFGSSEAVQNANLQTETALVRELDEFVTANGVVEYDETRLARLSARVPGIAWRVEKKVGDPVHKGEVLAILDSNDVGQAKADFLEAIVACELKTETLRRLDERRGSVPDQRIREAQAEARAARVRRYNCQQRLINLGLTVPEEFLSGMSDDKLARGIQFLGIPEETVARFGPEVVTANLIPLTAPFDGIVIDREIVTGEVVQTAHPQFVVADVSRMWLKLHVRKADVAQLALGQELTFTAIGLPDPVTSRISWIATEVDEKTRTVQVRAEVENPEIDSPSGVHDGQRLLRAHAFGTAEIRVRNEREVVVVPTSAVQSEGGHRLLFVPCADGVSFQPRAVNIGMSRDDWTEIVRGVAPGEEVVVSGARVLKAELVRVRSASR